MNNNVLMTSFSSYRTINKCKHTYLRKTKGIILINYIISAKSPEFSKLCSVEPLTGILYTHTHTHTHARAPVIKKIGKHYILFPVPKTLNAHLHILECEKSCSRYLFKLD